ncbi:MAG TPA: hypothetical protein V6D25_13310 [Leptolyngbyaceae cyanobacterium]
MILTVRQAKTTLQPSGLSRMRTEVVTQNPQIQIRTELVDANAVRIAIADNGAGIDESNL